MQYQTIISSADLERSLDDPQWVVLDCRFYFDDTDQGYKEFLEGHIPGAFYVHLDRDLSAPIIPGKTGRHPLPDVDRIVDRISSWGIDRTTQVVIYDNEYGALGARLWWILRWFGHNSAAILDGGWDAWLSGERQVEKKEKAPGRKKFLPDIQPQLIVDTQLIDEIREDPGFLLLDARSAERFSGINETIDPVAGHIPGAVSAPFSENLTEEGFLKSRSELQDRFRGILGDHDPVNTVFYCGSGVTAAQNILAMCQAGYAMPKLYPGSWSEWITDPTRPINEIRVELYNDR